MGVDSVCCEVNINQIFNHNFLFPNRTLDFPEGWQKYQRHRTASFSWEKDDKNNYYVVINNRKAKLRASICQEQSYSVPVYEKQVWEVGALLGVHHELWATIKVHFYSHPSSQILFSCVNFMLEPKCDYYCGLVTVPPGVDSALLEIGTSEAGTLWIREVSFKRIFPVEKYDSDAQGRLNINNVASVGRILEPVEVNGTFELV